MRALRVIMTVGILCSPWLAAAEDAGLDRRLKRLALELRCLVCQNQTLADSDAPLAEDLRAEIRTMMVRGRSDEEILDFLVSRYGDFVLYRPPLKATTVLLWVGPFLFLAGGGAALWVAIRRRQAPQDQDTPPTTEVQP